MRFMLLLVCLVLALGCDMYNGKQQQYHPPSFVVEMFDYANGSTAALTSYGVTDDPCETAMAEYNSATEATQTELNSCVAGGENKLCDHDNDTDAIHLRSKLALMLARHSYTQTLFNNCVMEQNKQVYDFSIVEDNEQKIHYSGGSMGEVLLDDTRFIGWREHKNSSGTVEKTNGEANVVDGERINLHLQKDKLRTQDRIDLVKNNALRQIATLGWLHNPGTNKDDEDTVPEHVVAHSTYMVEFDDGSSKEQLLSLRYYGGHILESKGAENSEASSEQPSSKVWLVLAHMKASGATILTTVCHIRTGEDYNKDCTRDVETSNFKLHYIDAKGNEQDGNDPLEPPTEEFKAFKRTAADFTANTQEQWAHGDYDKDKLDPRRVFFRGQGDDLASKREAVFTTGLPADSDSDS